MKASRRFFCWLLSLLMLVSPHAAIIAQEVEAVENVEPDTTLLADPAVVAVPEVVEHPLDITYLLPQACVVASFRPQKIVNSPIFKMMPIEVLQAASIKHTGIDALLMDRLLVSMEPPIAGPPNYAVMASFAAPVANKLLPQAVARMEKLEEERPHYKSAQPLEPSVYFPQDDVLLATPEATLQKFLLGDATPADQELHNRLRAAAGDDLYVGVDFVPLRPLVNAAMMQAQIPAELGHFYLAPDLIKLIELRMNVSHGDTSELVVEANNAEDAEKLEGVVLKSVDLIKAEALQEATRLKADPDPVQQAFGRYQERMMDEMSAAFVPKREGEKLVIFRVSGKEGQANMLTMTAVSGILVALILPAVQAAREAARRTTSTNNLRQILLALHNYHDSHKSFPAHANYSADGKPLLSWRVHILPFIEQQALYNQFHLDEPWDSEYNKKLLSTMPVQYIDPSSRLNPAEGRTHYLGVKGTGMAFTGTENGTALKAITDGTSNTLVVVQVNDDRAAPWTKPDDWEMDSQNPLAGLSGSMHPGIFIAGYADGSVRNISEGIDPTVFKALLTIGGGEKIDLP
jgi:type II secretory pathway pseudopilin PulG